MNKFSEHFRKVGCCLWSRQLEEESFEEALEDGSLSEGNKKTRPKRAALACEFKVSKLGHKKYLKRVPRDGSPIGSVHPIFPKIDKRLAEACFRMPSLYRKS